MNHGTHGRERHKVYEDWVLADTFQQVVKYIAFYLYMVHSGVNW